MRARMVLLYTRLCACGGHILTLSIADRRTVPLRADGFGYVRRRHDGYLVCSFTRGWLRAEPERSSVCARAAAAGLRPVYRSLGRA